MNTKKRYALIFALALLGGAALVAVTWAAPGNAPLAQGGAPAVVSYQGEVRVSGAPYTGNGYFKFAVVNAAGNAAYWSNDGTSAGGGERGPVQRPAGGYHAGRDDASADGGRL
jgi:hypothetical protein